MKVQFTEYNILYIQKTCLLHMILNRHVILAGAEI